MLVLQETVDTDSEAGNDSPRKAAKKKPTNPSSKGRKRKSDKVANDKEPEALPVKSEAKIEEDGNVCQPCPSTDPIL